jgi:hypothetical protein
MHEFIAKHQDKIAGTLSGFDRLVFRGPLPSIGHPDGIAISGQTKSSVRTLATGEGH